MSDDRVIVFTSAARNYLPKVRVLFDSLARHHPEWQRRLVLAERGSTAGDREQANAHDVRCVADLEIPDWEPWSFCHTLVELATAIKPFALRQLLNGDEPVRVLYMDPDIALFSRLDEIVAGLDHSSILLTPHQLLPENTLGRVIDNEIASLRHGVYNLGFLAVNGDDVGRAFAEWWAQRLYHFCRDEWQSGLFTDQKWIDLVPALFPRVGVLRSSRLNVASWNLSERALRAENGRFLVDGQPLGFYHFTAASGDSHELMALKNSNSPEALGPLLAWYRREEQAAPRPGSSAWSFALYSDGSAIADEHRRAFRDNRALQKKYANPWDAAGLGAALRANPDLLSAARTATGSPAISPGYAASEGAFDPAKVLRLLKAVATSPRALGMVARRAISILDQEGMQGIVRRLR